MGRRLPHPAHNSFLARGETHKENKGVRIHVSTMRVMEPFERSRESGGSSAALAGTEGQSCVRLEGKDWNKRGLAGQA